MTASKSKVVAAKRKKAPEPAKKALTIVFDDFGIPTFTFSGSLWVGKDIALVARLLARAYRTHKRAVRRQPIGG